MNIFDNTGKINKIPFRKLLKKGRSWTIARKLDLAKK
jgi:hypothetical protein